jgi:hypothetical protein
MRPTGTHLGLDKYGFKLTWVGMPGMSWINIVPIVFRSIRYFGIPRALLLHVGGNDLGNYSTKELVKTFKICNICCKSHVANNIFYFFNYFATKILALLIKLYCNGKRKEKELIVP